MTESHQEPIAAVRSQWAVLRSVWWALVFRELKTRFGTSRLGALWLIAEPLVHIVVLMAVFQALGRHAVFGVPFALFLAVGLVPFFMFSNILKRGLAAVEANKGLLVYRQLRPIDFISVRCGIEVVLSMVVIMLLGVMLSYRDWPVIPHDPLLALCAFVLLAVFSSGLALFASVINAFSHDAGQVMAFIPRPLYFISGVFFPLAVVPLPWRELLLMNPLAQYLELLRKAWFASYPEAGASWSYVGLCALISVAFGLLVYVRYEHRYRIVV
ncbi:MAG: ABC transporter permease [Planctomycetes bacterium]|nr:ABC transporter permease [Planctomycetota bacterium]